MDENKEFGMEQNLFQPEDNMTAPEIPESVTDEVRMPESQPEPLPQQEPVPADSPYVPSPRAQEPYRPRYQDALQEELPVPQKKRSGVVVKKILAWTAVLALVISSCAFTANRVNAKWEDRVAAMENAFSDQLDALQKQVQAMSPDSTGNSVSGTVAVANGMTAAQVYAQNVRSVVLIEATVSAELYGQISSGTSTGSGFILTEDGYVVTNFHVVEGATSVNVVLHDGTSYPASPVGQDSINDLAILKVDAVGLDPVSLGSSNNLIVGDQVVAIGNPLGELTATLTVGYVSAKERTINTDGTIINMIQTDAAINSGNSGGPLFNMRGQVVGITTAKYSGSSSSGATIEGIGFAIPISDVMGSIQDLIEFGYIKSAYLGVMVQNLDPAVADIYGLPVGAYVASVEEGYCAQKAGIRVKDIIIAVGEESIKSISDLSRAMRKYEPGEEAKIVIYRAGQVIEIQVKLDERPASAG